jgi:NAD+ kinase
MNRVMVQPNPTKGAALRVSRRLISLLLAEEFQVVALEEYREVLLFGLSEEEKRKIRFLREPEIYQACDFIMVVGGDGTILRIAGQASLYQKPVLGVNCGTVGFMSELEPDEIEMVRSVKSGNFTLDDRSMLDIQVFNSVGDEVYSTVALNEAVVTKGFFNRVIPLSVIVDGQEVFQFSGDGVIVTTPTGSTAYSLAAGGPILAPSSDCLAVTPICPHSLTIKSFVISAESIVTVMPEYKGHQVFLSPDGDTYELRSGDRVVIQRSQRTFSLLRIKGQGFYEIIRQKLANERTGK